MRKEKMKTFSGLPKMAKKICKIEASNVRYNVRLYFFDFFVAAAHWRCSLESRAPIAL